MVKRAHLNILLDIYMQVIGNAFLMPLCIKLLQMNGYVKYFDSNNKYINLLVDDKELLKKMQ